MILEVIQSTFGTDDARQTRLHISDGKNYGVGVVVAIGVRMDAGLRRGRVVHAVGMEDAASVRKERHLVLHVVLLLPDGPEEAGILQQG